MMLTREISLMCGLGHGCSLALHADGVVVAAVEHQHHELAAGDALHGVATHQAADVSGQALGVRGHALAPEHVLGGELVESGGVGRGRDLALEPGIEDVLHALGNVGGLTSRELYEMPTPARRCPRRALGGGPVDVGVLGVGPFEQPLPVQQPQHALGRALGDVVGAAQQDVAAGGCPAACSCSSLAVIRGKLGPGVKRSWSLVP